MIPSFALLAIVGCLIGFFVFRIPHGMLGVAVSVPLVVVFLLTRILVLVVPRDLPPPPKPLNLQNAAPPLVIFLSFGVAVVMLPSAGVYAAIGLNALARPSLSIAGWAFVVAFVVAFFDLAVAFAAALPLRDLMNFIISETAELFWDALRAPTDISVLIFRQFGKPLSGAH
jgi:hypothetical protein